MTTIIPDGTHVICLWAVPRSVSTAFEKTMSCRSDTSVTHEPFTDCYYFSRERRSARYGDQPHKRDVTIEQATAKILANSAPVVFVKDLAFQAEPYLTDELLSQVTNTFIIRHPRNVLRSLVPLKPDFTENEFGFTALARLFERVVEGLGRPPIIVEGDAFRHAPVDVLQRYCLSVGLLFDPAMLQWQDGRIREWGPDETQSQAKWHRTLESSHTILPPIDYSDIGVPLKRVAMYDRALQVYEQFLRFVALGASASVAL